MAKKRGQKKLQEFVLDCSVALAWYFKDEANPYANAVRKSLSRARAVVPALWPLEVANILVLGEHHGRSTEAEASKWPISSWPFASGCLWRRWMTGSRRRQRRPECPSTSREMVHSYYRSRR